MKVQEALDRIDSIKPNMVPPEIKVQWLSELDDVIRREIIQEHYDGPRPPHHHHHHHHWPGNPLEQHPHHHEKPMPEEEKQQYCAERRDEELLVPFPYDKLYQYYLAMQIDIVTAEIEKYNTDSQLFQAAYVEYQDWYNRHYYPRQRVCEFSL